MSERVYIHELVVAACPQDAGKNHGAVAAGAVDIGGFVLRNTQHGLIDGIQRGVFHIQHVFAVEFAFFTDIKYRRIRVGVADFGQLFGCDALDLIDFHAGFLPGIKAAFEVADAVVEAHTGQARDDFFFPSLVGDEQNLLFHVGD